MRFDLGLGLRLGPCPSLGRIEQCKIKPEPGPDLGLSLIESRLKIRLVSRSQKIPKFERFKAAIITKIYNPKSKSYHRGYNHTTNKSKSIERRDNYLDKSLRFILFIYFFLYNYLAYLYFPFNLL